MAILWFTVRGQSRPPPGFAKAVTIGCMTVAVGVWPMKAATAITAVPTPLPGMGRDILLTALITRLLEPLPQLPVIRWGIQARMMDALTALTATAGAIVSLTVILRLHMGMRLQAIGERLRQPIRPILPRVPFLDPDQGLHRRGNVHQVIIGCRTAAVGVWLIVGLMCQALPIPVAIILLI